MSVSWLITNLIASLLLPPLNGLLLVAAGWWMFHKHPRTARALIGAGLVLLWLLAIPVVGDAMLRTLEGDPVLPTNLQSAQAIVVLGGGRYRDPPEYERDTVSEPTLMRLRYAAKLHRDSGLPILVTGGKPDGGDVSEAESMQQTLNDGFGVPVRWVEGKSNTTEESAKYSFQLLRSAGIERIVLVTHAWHMPRSAYSFLKEGFVVIPAPTSFSREPRTPLDFLPKGYKESRNALHEWIGMIWYRMRS